MTSNDLKSLNMNHMVWYHMLVYQLGFHKIMKKIIYVVISWLDYERV